ncbi:MAG: DsbA family protein [Gemmatimonadaceae bacterium]|nr:DsbA family protein [Gemmatimonadaceae bacterium]
MLLRFGSSLLTLALLGCNGSEGAAATREADAATVRPAAVTAAAADSASAALLAKADAGRILGSPSAKVWLIIISDFQCPFCKSWHDESWEAIRRDYVETGKLRVAYVNLPLSIHPNAAPAAEVAMCASVQDKFWPVQDALFRTQRDWARLPDPQSFFEAIARQAGADVEALRSCVASKATRPLIKGDEERSVQAGAQSTPTFFVGNQALIGAQPLTAFRGAIEAALKSADKPAGR